MDDQAPDEAASPEDARKGIMNGRDTLRYNGQMKWIAVASGIVDLFYQADQAGRVKLQEMQLVGSSASKGAKKEASDDFADNVIAPS